VQVTTLYLWLEGCKEEIISSPERLESILRDAVGAGGFELFHLRAAAHDRGAFALAVVGESHIVLHSNADTRVLCAEVVSCTTVASAVASMDSVEGAVAHDSAHRQMIFYEPGRGLTPITAQVADRD